MWWCVVKGKGRGWTVRRQLFIIRRVDITCWKTVHDHVEVFASIVFSRDWWHLPRYIKERLARKPPTYPPSL